MDELVICRCEEVTLGQIRDAIRDGAKDLAGVKRRTRAQMGLCQGRTCESLISRILCEETGLAPEEVKPGSVRVPVVPVPFRVLAGEANE